MYLFTINPPPMTNQENFTFVRGIVNASDNVFKLKVAELSIVAFEKEYPNDNDAATVLKDLVNDKYKEVINLKPA